MKKLVLLCAVLLYPSHPARADRIELRTGQVFTGKLLRLTDGEVSIRLDSGGTMTFRLSGVRSVSRADEDEGSILVYGKDREDPDASLGPNGTILATPKAPEDQGKGAAPLNVLRREGDATEPRVRSGQRGEVVVSVPKHHFALTPPRGFVAWPEGTTGGAVLAYREPATQSTFLVTVQATKEDLERVKKSALRAYAEQFPTFHVIEDEAIGPKEDSAPPQAWRLEIETRLEGAPFRQMQVYRKRGSEVVVVSCAAAARDAERLREAFEESLQSFRFTLEESPTRSGPVDPLDPANPPSALETHRVP
jgi:hypothetical protein